jgi:hypothetical protein
MCGMPVSRSDRRIVVVGTPDDQALFEEADAYKMLLAGTTPLSIADAPKQGRELVQVTDDLQRGD